MTRILGTIPKRDAVDSNDAWNGKGMLLPWKCIKKDYHRAYDSESLMDSAQTYGPPERQSGRQLAAGGGLPFGFIAYSGTAVSVFFCYLDILAGLLLPLIGVEGMQVNEHVQAALMSVFVLVSVGAMFRDAPRCRSWWPFGLGLLAFAIIVGTLYLYYDVRVLILGYILLVMAVVLNPAFMLQHLNLSVHLQASELAQLNTALEDRVQTQVDEIDRLARLKRFLSSEIAEMITSEGDERLLESHRKLVACLFCDVRNFTSFSESVEPEEVMDVLRNVHETFGDLVAKHGGTIGFRAGDGLMVIFNDPMPCKEPVLRAVELASEMKTGFAAVRDKWQRIGQEIGFGIGIAYGYATLGVIGTEGRYDYTAIGNVVNLASQLCDRAADGEILLDLRAKVEVEGKVEVEELGTVDVKGVGREVEVFRVI